MARAASMVARQDVTWSGWPYPPSGPNVTTTSGSKSSMTVRAAAATSASGCSASRPSPRSRQVTWSTPRALAEASSSLTRMAPSTRLVAVAASRIWPASPCVRDTIAVTAPAPAHRAIVPPTQKTSSSGWANSPRTRGALPPGTAEPHTVAGSASLSFENSEIGCSVPTPGTRNRPPLTRTSHRLGAATARRMGW